MDIGKIVGFSVSALAVLPLFVGGVLNLMKSAVARKNIEHVGYTGFLTPFGISTILLGTLTLVPATSFLGVILTTGWMGGAIAAHVRVKDQYFIQAIIPILVWVGFGLRHQREMHLLLGF